MPAEFRRFHSVEFYLGYCITRKKLLCLDTGHVHPTESISDKISSVLLYLPEILLAKRASPAPASPRRRSG